LLRIERRRARRDAAAGLAWVSPWLIGFLAFMLLPAAMSFYYSFTEYPMIERPLWVGGANYARLLSDSTFHKALTNTLVYAAATIPIGALAALIVAALLNTRVRLAGFFQAAVFVPTLVPLVAVAMIFLWIFNAERGLVNVVLGLVGVHGPNWLLDANWIMPALVIMSLWGIGQSVVIYLAALQDVPPQLYEAASLDGMGPVRRFVHVTMPMLSPVILFNVITQTIAAFQVFAVPFILFTLPGRPRGGPSQTAYFYTMYLYDSAFSYGQMGYASAMAWVQLVMVLVLTALMFAASRRLVYYRGAP
jgi:multiple sugar transport system permease protein